MKMCLNKIKNEVESHSDYRFSIVLALKKPVLKLLHMPQDIEIYVEFNRSVKLINPFVAVVLVNIKINKIERNNYLYDLNRTLIFIDNHLKRHIIFYPKKIINEVYKQLSLEI